MKPLAIIPNYVRTIEDCQLLSVCLTTLRDTVGDDCDVMVVDDGSSETDLVTYCRGLTEAVGGEFRARSENGGFSRAVNEGLRVALRDDRDAVLVNADIQFTTKTWLKLMLKQRTSDDSGLASVVGALLSYPNGLIQHGGVVFSLLTRDFSHRYNYGPENLPEAQVATVGPVTGALMFIRHECLQNVGLFDETFRLGWEDIDYGVRVWLSGRECIYQPGVRAIHHESFFRGRADEKIQRWTNESWLRFCAKYGQISFAQFVPSLTIPEEDE